MADNNDQQYQSPQQPATPGLPTKLPTNGLAIASLVLGLLSFTCLPAIPAIILGIIALDQIKKTGKTTGSGLATAGIVTGGLGFFLLVIVLIMGPLAGILFPSFSRTKDMAKRASCLSNVKQISFAVLQYAQDHNGKYPDPDKWNDEMLPYTKSKTLHMCPSMTRQPEPSYAMNGSLKGALTNTVKSPQDLVVIYDSLPGANRHGGAELLPKPARHMSNNIGYADGHAKSVSAINESLLVWDPSKQGKPQPQVHKPVQ